MNEDDILKALQQALGPGVQIMNAGELGGGGRDRRPAPPTPEAAKKQLQDYLDNATKALDLKQGDYVKRTLVGRSRYVIPEDSMKAVVVRRLPTPQIDKEDHVCDLMIAVAVAPGITLTYLVDSAYFTLEDGPTNVFKLPLKGQ